MRTNLIDWIYAILLVFIVLFADSMAETISETISFFWSN